MSLADRINRLVLRRIGRGTARPTVAGDAIRLGPELVPLATVSGLVAHEVDVHAGTLSALTLALDDGRTVTLTEEDACWRDLLAALDRLALTAAPSRDWTTAVLAGGAPMVLRRNGLPTA